MAGPDLNLLTALDVLLREGSVAGAARSLRLSPSAMSRTLARLRATTGDPLLVRAGRGLVPSPRALELREQVGAVVRDANAVLSAAGDVDVATLSRTFTIRTSNEFVESFGPRLIKRAAKEAPKIRLRFVPRDARDGEPLRRGAVDLDIGVVGRDLAPEIRAVTLFTDRFVGVVRAGHPLSSGRTTGARYAAAKHVEVAHHLPGPVDAALGAMGLEREVAVVVASFSAAVAFARASELVATVPDLHTRHLQGAVRRFALPVPIPPIPVSLIWHPRHEGDPAHRWLRGCVRAVCAVCADHP